MWKQSRAALDFFRNNGVKFWQMSNDNIRLPVNSLDYVLSSVDGTELIVYKRNGNGKSTGINMKGLSGTYSVRWYNPREGGPLELGTVTSIVGGDDSLVSYGNAPGSIDKDWVVLLRIQ
jgi:Putative collagen-binding domain of a collagenase